MKHIYFIFILFCFTFTNDGTATKKVVIAPEGLVGMYTALFCNPGGFAKLRSYFKTVSPEN